MKNNNFGLSKDNIEENKMYLTSDLINKSIDNLISTFLSSLLYDYTKSRIIDNPIVLERLKKVLRDELDRVVKVSVL